MMKNSWPRHVVLDTSEDGVVGGQRDACRAEGQTHNSHKKAYAAIDRGVTGSGVQDQHPGLICRAAPVFSALNGPWCHEKCGRATALYALHLCAIRLHGAETSSSLASSRGDAATIVFSEALIFDVASRRVQKRPSSTSPVSTRCSLAGLPPGRSENGVGELVRRACTVWAVFAVPLAGWTLLWKPNTMDGAHDLNTEHNFVCELCKLVVIDREDQRQKRSKSRSNKNVGWSDTAGFDGLVSVFGRASNRKEQKQRLPCRLGWLRK